MFRRLYELGADFNALLRMYLAHSQIFVLLALVIASSILFLLHGPALVTRRARGYKRISRPLKEELRLAATRLLHSWHNTQPQRDSNARLDRLPTELLHQISLYACTDGGRTGRSLALVSRCIHAASRGARFHSVSLLSGSHWAVRRLLEEFDAACDAAQREGAVVPRIRHLCLVPHQFFHDEDEDDGVLSFADPRRRAHFATIRRHLKLKAQSASSRPRAAEEAGIGWEEEEEEWEAFMDAMEARYHAAAETLLQKVAGDLETLCVLQVAASIGEPKPQPFQLGRRDFPRLRELWLFDGPPRFLFSTEAGASADADGRTHGPQHVPRFPVLSRLHIVSPGPNFIDIDLVPWVRDAPQLDALRVTSDAFIHSTVPGWVRNLLSATSAHWPRAAPVHILVGLPTPQGVHGDDELTWAHMHHFGAEAVFDALQAAGAPLVFVPYYCYQDVVDDPAIGRLRGPAEVRRDWLARIAPAQGAGASRWMDGIYARDFWREYRGDGFLRKLAISRQVRSAALYVPPLRIWPGEGRDAYQEFP